MLSRTRRIPATIKNARYFSTPAFNDWSRRMSDLQSKYPRLYSDDFISDQQKLLSKAQSNLSGLLSKYETARKSIDEQTGEDVFVELNEQELLANLPTPVRTIVQTPEQVDVKLAEGNSFVSDLLEMQSQAGLSEEDANLRMMRVGQYADKVDYWRARLPDDFDDTGDLGLPIADTELDAWVNYQYYHAPFDVKAEMIEGQKEREAQWLLEVDERLVNLLKERHTNFDEAKWRRFTEITNDLFHPYSINHYYLSDYAKSLFRAALWQSEDRTRPVQESVERVLDLLENGQDDEPAILRRMYELYPDSRLAKFAALQLQIRDPLFAAKLCDEARARMDQVAFDRGVKDVLRPLEIPLIDNDIEEQEIALRDASVSINTIKRAINNLEEEKASFDMEVPSLETVLDEILTERLWGNDTSRVREAIVSYASGKGSLDAIDDAIVQAMQPDGETGSFDDNEILQMCVRYHNARYDDKSRWNLMEYLLSVDPKNEESKLKARRFVKEQFDQLGIDPLVRNLVRVLIDDNQCEKMVVILEDFLTIMKTYRGEVDGSVISAVELDDATFDSIRRAVETANPDKKITLDRQVEPGLGAGFVVKAGVQKFDFSLAAHIHESRKQVGM